MIKRFAILTVLLSFLLLFENCTLVPGTGSKNDDAGNLSIMLWNVENLFDGIDHGTEYDEYSLSRGWNSKKYEARILSISQAIESAFSADHSTESYDRFPPALIGLVEVENLQVLEDLALGPLSKYGYGWCFFAKLPGMALGTGVMSRLPLSGTKAHSITASGETIPRPVMEFHLETEGENIVFFLCHWKSKIGGEEATESLRRASARVIGRRTEEIYRDEPEKAIIVMGDLNENHDEFYRFSGTRVSALLPDDPHAANSAASQNIWNFLLLSEEKPPRSRYFDNQDSGRNLPVFYSPWGNELTDGSYYYKGEWETIDHFLLGEGLFNGIGWEFENCRVFARPPFTNTSGFPAAYTPRNGTGLSDHLPLMLYLKRAERDR